MAGKGTISVNQSPQYGDKSALASASKAVTKTPMTGNPTPAPSAGRPAGAGASQTGNTPAVEQEQSNIDPAHKEMMAELAQAFRTNQFWQNVLAQYPSEWSRMYAQDAEKAYQRISQKTRANTPYFE